MYKRSRLSGRGAGVNQRDANFALKLGSRSSERRPKSPLSREPRPGPSDLSKAHTQLRPAASEHDSDSQPLPQSKKHQHQQHDNHHEEQQHERQQQKQEQQDEPKQDHQRRRRDRKQGHRSPDRHTLKHSTKRRQEIPAKSRSSRRAVSSAEDSSDDEDAVEADETDARRTTSIIVKERSTHQSTHEYGTSHLPVHSGSLLPSVQTKPSAGRIILRLSQGSGTMRTQPGDANSQAANSATSRVPPSIQNKDPILSAEISTDTAKSHLDVVNGTANYPASDSSDTLSELSDDEDKPTDEDEHDDDDDENIEDSEERFLIADTIRKINKTTKSQNHLNSGLPVINAGPTDENDAFEVIGEANLGEFENLSHPFTSFARSSTLYSVRQRGSEDAPVTWSGAEESEIGDLDDLLGLTEQESSFLLGNLSDDSTTDKTMRFEDFLAQDDGTDFSDSAESADDEGEDESAPGDISEEEAANDDDPHIVTSHEIVEQGGFVFYRAGSEEDDNESQVLAQDVPIDANDSGDTTDTLDDTDHLGMIRFGIESADEGDEDAEEALAKARRDRGLLDAQNIGLSVSFDALAEQPEAVIAKAARSLGVSQDRAAQILTSIGMSLLLDAGNSQNMDTFSRPTAPAPPSSTSAQYGNTFRRLSSRTHASSPPTTAEVHLSPATNLSRPPMGNFLPSRELDLCVIVPAGSDGHIASPFSSRKSRRRASRTCNEVSGSPSGWTHSRGQSILSSTSGTSSQAGQYPCFDEEHYTVYVDINEFLDTDMMQAGTSSSTDEEDDLDDGASISTAVAGSVVGDFGRWDRVPIGAFRSRYPDPVQASSHPQAGNALMSSSAHGVSLHPTVSSLGKRKRRYIPVSPVLLPVNASHSNIKAISQAKSHRQRRKDKQQSKKRIRTHSRLGQSPSKLGGGPKTDRSRGADHTLPSEGLGHIVSPLFSGVAGINAIPSFSL